MSPTLIRLSPLLLMFLTGMASAGIFDDPKNLKVLPENISARQLGATMRNFALGTGLRCSSCHLGEEGQQLTEYDFASDDKELKRKARLMLKMVTAINDTHLSGVSEEHIVVECVTCHRGVQKPKMLDQVLAEAADEKGVAAIRETYFALKEKYYGTHSYDFSERALSSIVRSRAGARKMDQAAAVLDIMLEEDPRSFDGHFLYGELSRMNGDLETAISYLQKAVEIKPESAGVARRLDQVKQELADSAEK